MLANFISHMIYTDLFFIFVLWIYDQLLANPNDPLRSSTAIVNRKCQYYGFEKGKQNKSYVYIMRCWGLYKYVYIQRIKNNAKMCIPLCQTYKPTVIEN